MNFEEAYKNYKAGTATEEEIELVQGEIAKAKALSSLWDDDGLVVSTPVIKEADIEEVRAAKRQHFFKITLIGLTIVMAVLLALGAILGGVFGSASSYAKSAIVYDKAACEQIALEHVHFLEHQLPWMSAFIPYPCPEDEAFEVRHIDAKFYFESDLKSSYYKYRVEIRLQTSAGRKTYEIDVHTKTGYATVHDVKVRSV